MINKEQVEQIQRETGDDLVAQSLKGNTLWLVKRDGGIPCICQFKFNKDGYTQTTEADNPDQAFCPLDFLELAPETNSEWRQKVLDYWEKKKLARNQWKDIKKAFKNLKENQTILIYFHDDWNLEFGYLESIIPGKVRNSGKLWKIKQIDSIEKWEIIES